MLTSSWNLAIYTINANSRGVAMCVLASWGKMQHMEWVGPLVLVFPGWCQKPLGRMGANDSRTQQMELLFCALDSTEPFSRRVTTYVVTEHKVEWGANIRQIQWQPEKSVEIVLTYDNRWGTEITTKSVKQDWIVAARNIWEHLQYQWYRHSYVCPQGAGHRTTPGLDC